jgi:quercetin dioxygenase-like cupin family protein
MKLVQFREAEAVPVEAPGTVGVRARVLLAASDGAPNFTMRLFELAPGGRTPYHRHDYEHEVFVLSGRGTVRQGDERTHLAPGTAVLVQPMEWHGFEADGQQGMQMLCLVPNRAYVPGQFRIDEGS